MVSGVPNLQTELNYLDSFKSYCNSSDLSFLGSGGWGGWVLGWSAIVYMSSGMFRGKESSNRIELSRLVQDLLNFGVFGLPAALGLGGVPHTCAHACAHTYTHAHMVNMIISCKWPPLLGESLGIPYDVHMRMRAHACARGWGAPSHHPPPPHPPEGDPQNHSKFNSTWTNQDISILFEDLKCVETPQTHGWVYNLVGGWVGWWVGVRSNHWKFENCWLNQDNSILFEDLWFVETPPPMGGCGWLGGSMDGVRSNDKI